VLRWNGGGPAVEQALHRRSDDMAFSVAISGGLSGGVVVVEDALKALKFVLVAGVPEGGGKRVVDEWPELGDLIADLVEGAVGAGDLTQLGAARSASRERRAGGDRCRLSRSLRSHG
jgi:hypothetical protein